MAAYYNEIDLKTAAWLRELMKAGLIADGEVDTRSIVDVRPDDLRGFVQCHFFAGIGGWSYALRLARWDDARPVWSGSCPCQPFSSAGAQAGGNDSRDLWPAWYQLVKECRPSVVFGEQVESAIGHGWLDRLCDDLEREDYAVGAVGLPAACVGAFHIRPRLYFVADTDLGGRPAGHRAAGAHTAAIFARQPSTHVDGLAESRSAERRQGRSGRSRTPERGPHAESSGSGDVSELADPAGQRRTRERVLLRPEETRRHAADVSEVAGSGAVGELGESDNEREAAVRGVSERSAIERGRSPWASADWITCRDGKSRPIEPGSFPLAHGVPARVGRLRGYGNAIVPEVAAAFIEAYEGREVC